jgi:hypothetical protein
MTQLIKSVPLAGRNLMGLRPAQATLYKYLKKCTEEQTTVNLDEVVRIYWNEVKVANALYTDSYGTWTGMKEKNPRYATINKDIPAFAIAHPEHCNYSYTVVGPARMWMQNTIGSLVMRGLLTIIPNLDIKIIEE